MGAKCFDGAAFTAAMFRAQLDAHDIDDIIAGYYPPGDAGGVRAGDCGAYSRLHDPPVYFRI
jgi:hypothetical protein